MGRGQYDRSKMKRHKESLEDVRYGYVPPGLQAERDAFITKELEKNPSLSFEKCRTMLKEGSMAGIGVKTFSKMKNDNVKVSNRSVETKRVVMSNNCEKRTLDIELGGDVQYTAIRFMKGKVVLAELPMVRA